MTEGETVFSNAINHERLMQASGQFVESLARSGAPQERLVANRILDSQSVWVRWESEHSGLMRTVAQQQRVPGQITVLKVACFSLIHRKALFEHLRDQQLRGRVRHQLLRFFHRTHGYSQALVSEHDSYLRSACSFLCSSHVGSAVMIDGVFQDPMRRYEELYAEYFRAFCEGYVISEEGEQTASQALLPYLKMQIAEQRRVVLELPRVTPYVLPDAALRRPTGDTQVLRADAIRVKFGQGFG
jgi:hypothetical protein